MYNHYEIVDAPNYRYGFQSPTMPQFSYPEIDIDSPNTPPYAPTYAPKLITPAQDVKQVTVLDNREIRVPIGWKGANITQPISLTWDPTKTNITKATLTVRALSQANSMNLSIYLNDLDQEIGGVGWAFLEGGSWKQTTFDVTGRLANGKNNFLADYWVSLGINVTGTSAYVYLDLAIEYTGVEPGTTVDPLPWDPTLLLWGVGIVGAGIIAYKFILPAVKGEYRSIKSKVGL